MDKARNTVDHRSTCGPNFKGEDKFTSAEKTAIHICRNPYGYSDDEQRKARNDVCGFFESAREAYLNMRQWANDNGVDTTAYYGP